ncbi:PLP-dependent aminotransferase family protein [Paenibacillus rhizolycopersici]|uniref:aminotransferase-like domain-containing protein n=1 Tax=Paenibacillus rhizolycopersici TaxID=2780073 RepID=UPI003D2DEEAD
MNTRPKPAESGKILYTQVYDYIGDRIRRGDWKAHEKLPSVRALAEELQLHRLTVFRAYGLLKEHGIVYVKEKSGYFVSEEQPHADPAEPKGEEAAFSVPTPAGAGEKPLHGPRYEVGRLQNTLSEIHQIPAACSFSQALIDPNLLPNLFLSDHVKQVFDRYPKLLGTYSSVQGDEELRELLSSDMQRKDKLQVSPDELLITTGGQQAIDLLSGVFLRPMDYVLVERPTYSSALDCFRQRGARLLPVEICQEGYDLDLVEVCMKRHKPRLFYMNPTFHNPTGFTVPAAQRKRLVELAERYGCLIVEDDAVHDVYFDAPPPPPLYSYDTEGWVVYLRSFSKYLAPGLRICAVAARSAVMAPLLTAKSLADNGTPLVNQKLFQHCFESERLQQHLEKLRTALQMRRDAMEQALGAGPGGWQWHRPQGGLNLWVRFPDGLNANQLLTESVRRGLTFVPGTICDPLGEMTNRIRLSYSFMNEAKTREGVHLLVQVADQLA